MIESVRNIFSLLGGSSRKRDIEGAARYLQFSGEEVFSSESTEGQPGAKNSVPGQMAASGADPFTAETFSSKDRPELEVLLRESLGDRCPILKSQLRLGESIGEMFQRVTGNPLIITIDGLSAYGKGAAGKFLASYYGVREMSSGLAYRAGAYVCKHELKSIRNRSWTRRRSEEAHSEVLSPEEARDVVAVVAGAISDGRLRVVNSDSGTKVLLQCGRRAVDITPKLLSHEFAQGASILGEIGEVRSALLPFLRSFGSSGWVTDGRDMGTEVFPDASVKLFFGDADEEQRLEHAYVRGEWRMNQWSKKDLDRMEGVPALSDWITDPKEMEQFTPEERDMLQFANILSWSTDSLLSRDEHDLNRKVAPLRCPDDAICFSPINNRAHPPEGDRFYIPEDGRVDEQGRAIPENRLNGIFTATESEVREQVAKLVDARIEEILKEHLGQRGASALAEAKSPSLRIPGRDAQAAKDQEANDLPNRRRRAGGS